MSGPKWKAEAKLKLLKRHDAEAYETSKREMKERYLPEHGELYRARQTRSTSSAATIALARTWLSESQADDFEFEATGSGIFHDRTSKDFQRCRIDLPCIRPEGIAAEVLSRARVAVRIFVWNNGWAVQSF